MIFLSISATNCIPRRSEYLPAEPKIVPVEAAAGDTPSSSGQCFGIFLQAEGAEIINEENWGLKKLAYPIQKKSTGFYQLVEFNADPTVIDKLELNFRRDERVIRFLTFKMDKYAAEYAAKRRSVKSNKKED